MRSAGCSPKSIKSNLLYWIDQLIELDPSSRSCGSGTKKRNRSVATWPQFGGTVCPGVGLEMEQCGNEPCPSGMYSLSNERMRSWVTFFDIVDCEWTEWEGWIWVALYSVSLMLWSSFPFSQSQWTVPGVHGAHGQAVLLHVVVARTSGWG